VVLTNFRPRSRVEPPDGSRAFADAVQRLREHAAELPAIGHRARAPREAEFSRERLADVFVKTLESVGTLVRLREKGRQVGETIRPMRPADAAVVARLHAETISAGFLSKLGQRFLRQLYLGVAADPGSRVWVALRDGQVLGFLAYSQNVGGMYRRVLRARFWRLGLASLPRSLNPRLIKEVLDTLRYPAKQAAQDLPPAEILSVGVDSQARGSGLGRRLVEQALARARQDGQAQLKVLAGADLDAANRFYPACGFRKTAEIIQHGHVLNVYIATTASPA
jgi:ribosomal protein S18 acetylase RimI-like enzyme